MPLSWNEIKSRAIAFSREWTTRPLPAKCAERAEAQTFWNEFFEVFGKKRRHVAAFEALVKNLEGQKVDAAVWFPPIPSLRASRRHFYGITFSTLPSENPFCPSYVRVGKRGTREVLGWPGGPQGN